MWLIRINDLRRSTALRPVYALCSMKLATPRRRLTRGLDQARRGLNAGLKNAGISGNWNSGVPMTDLQQHVSSPVSDQFTIPLGLSKSGQSEAPYARFSGKLSRFLARHVATKKLAMRNSKPIISFTFDDVPASACDTGVRILEQHGVRGTFYIAGAGFGRNSPVGTLATPDLLRPIWLRGHEIGCQTHNHSAVSRLSRDELRREFNCNQAALKNIDANIPVRNFAYPYGDLSFGARRQLETLFDCCRSVDHGINTGIINLGALKSWPLENASLDRSRITALIAETIQTNGWLIFFSHDVVEQPSRFGIDPGLLEWTVKTAKQSGATIAPIADGLKYAAGSVFDTRPSADSATRS
jgi:peptidoglycan/xylan/chitin deacetylase (PgdA/CDA1 family)